MADLGGGARAANGSARTTQGPVPVSASQPQSTRAPPPFMPPTEIMRRRGEREQRRQQQLEEEKRAAAPPGAQETSQNPQQTEQPQRLPQSGHRRTQTVTQATYPPLQAGAQPQSSAQRTQSDPQPGRPRATSQSQQTPRPVPTAGPSGSQARPQARAQQPQQQQQSPPSQRAPQPQSRPIAGGGSTRAPAPGASEPSQEAARRPSNVSSFPHAFERWEIMSSHWEGLTSYWLHRLEQNKDELRKEPMLTQLSRQVTDLSAAGANLFHAVVELQRLRASSERKFQRWFIETRKDAERAGEVVKQLENQVLAERRARQDADARIQAAQDGAREAHTLVKEMQRELRISKEESRRAWEELGRREQEERDRTAALRDGQPIVVGGYQVYPRMQPGQPDDGTEQHEMAEYGYGPSDAGAGPSDVGAGVGHEGLPYDPTRSPANTDPFTEPAPAAGSSLAGPFQPEYPFPSETPVQGAAEGADARSTLPSQQPPTTTSAGDFYRLGNTHLGAGPGAQEDPHPYVPGSEDWASSAGEEDDYATDVQGNVLLDAAGRPVPWRRGVQGPVEDDEGVRYPAVPAMTSAAVPPGRQQQPVTTMAGVSLPPAASAGAVSASAPPAVPLAVPLPPGSVGPGPDYEGDGYDEWEERMRHHHPSRLSDVLEMDEDERSRVSEMGEGQGRGAPF
ncbi:hypothetical protein EJ06DRAFT_154158 [Trichodelitschia bisporula]|uniref:Uncharacterized protein n=1 Tax=Trichodelitschia bisporula TaxID=703511 RepID=A0A6G1HNQ0_9PEZI|nr:hypothetical protein EJ06DRAFT_154158 [Trichodelitschia bisporula]